MEAIAAKKAHNEIQEIVAHTSCVHCTSMLTGRPCGGHCSISERQNTMVHTSCVHCTHVLTGRHCGGHSSKEAPSLPPHATCHSAAGGGDNTGMCVCVCVFVCAVSSGDTTVLQLWVTALKVMCMCVCKCVCVFNRYHSTTVVGDSTEIYV